MVQIVQVNVYQDIAPEASTLQQSGVVVSIGGTTTAAGTTTTLTELSDLTPILGYAVNISSITWASGVLTITLGTSLTLTNGTTVLGLIQNAVPTTVNSSLTNPVMFTVASPTTLTTPLATSPGTVTTPGTFMYQDVYGLNNFVTTFFAQGQGAQLDVLELGPMTPAQSITALETWITSNPGQYYCYAFPDFTDGVTGLTAFLENYNSTTAKIYFFLGTAPGTYTDYAATNKCLSTFIPSPVAQATERPSATMMYKILSYSPSATNMVTPMAFTEVDGVTPYPTKGNAALLAALKTAGVNVIQTAAVGGINLNILCYGTTMDGRDFTYWYSVDWMQINVALNLSNAIINGSNNPINPLYYNQAGIDTLQAVAQDTANTAITYGLAVSPISVTATPFATYVVQNPDDYPVGRYAGMAMTYTPARGFETIIFNITVSDFIQA